jgi:hypothetical protein
MMNMNHDAAGMLLRLLVQDDHRVAELTSESTIVLFEV